MKRQGRELTNDIDTSRSARNLLGFDAVLVLESLSEVIPALSLVEERAGGVDLVERSSEREGRIGHGES